MRIQPSIIDFIDDDAFYVIFENKGVYVLILQYISLVGICY